MARTKTGVISGIAEHKKVLDLVEQGRAKIIKEFRNGEATFIATGASGSHIGIIAKNYKYLFEKSLSERGSGDGLFEGCSQTTFPPG